MLRDETLVDATEALVDAFNDSRDIDGGVADAGLLTSRTSDRQANRY